MIMANGFCRKCKMMITNGQLKAVRGFPREKEEPVKPVERKSSQRSMGVVWVENVMCGVLPVLLC